MQRTKTTVSSNPRSTPKSVRTTTTTTKLPNRNQPNARPRRNRSKRGASSASFKVNPYVSAILDPYNSPGIRIPDEECQLTGTGQLVNDGILSVPTTSADSAFVIAFTPQCPTQSIYSYTTSTTGSNFSVAASGNGANLRGTSNLTQIATSIRVVSAELSYEFIGSTSQDSGYAFGGQRVADELGIGGMINSNTVVGLMAQPYIKQWSYRNGGRVIYRPLDNVDREFSSAGFTPEDYHTHYSRYPHALWIAVAAGYNTTLVTSMKYRMVVNYEYVSVQGSSSFIQLQTGEHNSSWMEQASNVLSNMASSAIPSSERVISILGSHAMQIANNYASGYVAQVGAQSLRQSGVLGPRRIVY